MYTAHDRFEGACSLVGLAALFLLAAACGGAPNSGAPMVNNSEPEPQVGTPQVESLVLAPDTFEDLIEITGEIDAVDDAVLSADRSGMVEMLADLGQRVARGTIVARLDQKLADVAVELAEAAVDNAAAALTLAEDNFQRMEPLYKDSIISALEFQQVTTGLQQARAAMRQATAQQSQAQEQLSNTLIRAPFPGTVEEHRVMVGERVAPGSPVIRIVNASRVKVSVGVPERYAGDIEIGTEVRLAFPALANLTRSGRVTFAANSINPRSRTFSIEAEVENEDGRLKPDMVADVWISRELFEGVLVIPRIAVVRSELGRSVYVIDRSDETPIALQRMITPGPSYAERIIVEAGLSEGDEVIVLGQNTVTDGGAVTVARQYHRLDEEGIPVPDTDEPAE